MAVTNDSKTGTAPYSNKTIEEIRTLIISSIQQQWNNQLRILPKSFVRILATVMAGVFIILFKQIGWLFLQIFPETAYWGEVNILGSRIRPLVKWGVLLGAGEPRPGTRWTGKIRVKVVSLNSFLKTGTQLKSNLTGKLYVIEETTALNGETVEVNIVCTETGTAGNIEPGEQLYFVSPQGNVEKITTITASNDAMNDETEADYRYRVVNRWRMQPQGGALADYRIWASEVAGVLNVYPYKDGNSPSGVLLYVSGNTSVYPDRVPSGEVLTAVGKACTYNPETGKASRKPITATIDPRGDESYSNIKPVNIVVFDVYINDFNTDDFNRTNGISAGEFALSVKEPVEEYFLGREPYIRGLSDDNNKTNLVSRNSVSSVVDQVAISLKAEFESVTMHHCKDDGSGNTEEVSRYELRMGELCRLGKLFINGEEF